jgi:hypothetical protein
MFPEFFNPEVSLPGICHELRMRAVKTRMINLPAVYMHSSRAADGSSLPPFLL